MLAGVFLLVVAHGVEVQVGVQLRHRFGRVRPRDSYDFKESSLFYAVI